MARTFFTGGTMPSHDLLLHFQNQLKLEKRWVVNGVHYARTLDAWLAKMDAKYSDVWPLLQATYGKKNHEILQLFFKIEFILKAKTKRPVGTSIGECFLLFAQKPLVTIMATIGWCLITLLSNKSFFCVNSTGCSCGGV